LLHQFFLKPIEKKKKRGVGLGIKKIAQHACQGLSYFFLFFKWTNNMSFILFFFKKIKNEVSFVFCISQWHGSPKNQGLIFFNLKPIFNPSLIQNTYKTPQILWLTYPWSQKKKNQRNSLKNRNQLEAKINHIVRSTSSNKK